MGCDCCDETFVLELSGDHEGAKSPLRLLRKAVILLFDTKDTWPVAL
jgi:hypothetical protein